MSPISTALLKKSGLSTYRQLLDVVGNYIGRPTQLYLKAMGGRPAGLRVYPLNLFGRGSRTDPILALAYCRHPSLNVKRGIYHYS
jgi:hypothetical protein